MKTLLILLILLFNIGVKAQAPLQVVVAYPALTFSNPLHMTHAGDGTNRVFVVQQGGKIIVFPNDSNVTQANTKIFLDISNKISSSSGEQGLLGLVFHPNYASNGYFYVNYTAPTPLRTVISRFKVSSGNPDKADSLSEYKILEISQPFTNHNGGSVMFGLDGYLYIGMGDGGSEGDPNNNGQNLQILLGKMLRIDVNDTTAMRRYVIPPSNPFYNNPTAGKEEIYTWGMRNPWKFSQDPVTGFFYAGDVGQNTWEEIDIIKNGKNYGWRVMEGFVCYNPSTGCDTSGKELPIKTYSHTSGSCSVSGGYVYRGTRRPELQGAYIYGDYCSGRIWMLRYNGSAVTADSLILLSGLTLAAFGTDQNNELYMLNLTSTGKIFRFNRTFPTGIGEETGLIPKEYSLGQNYPNPFNGGTIIKYSLPQNGKVTLKVYDLSGREISVIVNSYQSAGNYSIPFSLSENSTNGISSGVYFYTIQSGNFSEVKRMVYLK